VLIVIICTFFPDIKSITSNVARRSLVATGNVRIPNLRLKAEKKTSLLAF